MTAEQKLNKVKEHVVKEIARYKDLWAHDLKNSRENDMAMDREATRVLTKIKIILEED